MSVIDVERPARVIHHLHNVLGVSIPDPKHIMSFTPVLNPYLPRPLSCPSTCDAVKARKMQLTERGTARSITIEQPGHFPSRWDAAAMRCDASTCYPEDQKWSSEWLRCLTTVRCRSFPFRRTCEEGIHACGFLVSHGTLLLGFV
jgi:hypothetical protein